MWEALSNNSGRDRAIETLIDMEPHGAFYRAARVLDEAVPNALTNRPNLITRPALVEQANSLAKYEIDTIIKYDEEFQPSRSTQNRLKEYPSDYKDRILRHHDKIVTVQRVHGTTGTLSQIAAAPPPSLVAALRHLYGSTSSPEGAKQTEAQEEDNENTSRAVLLRSLLRMISNHEAFSTGVSVSSPKDVKHIIEDITEDLQEKGSNDSDEKDSTMNETIGDMNVDSVDGRLPTANLESIVGNVLRTGLGNPSSNTRNGKSFLDGLLIAVLSILSEMTKENEDGEVGIEIKKKQGHELPGPSSSVESTEPITPALQVGGILSLLQSDSTADDEKNVFSLDEDILTYLGKAAATYEERIEIRKAHLLAKLQAEREKEAAMKKEKSIEEKDEEGVGNKEADENTASQDPAPVTPTSSAPMTPTGGDITPGSENQRRESAASALDNDEEINENDAVAASDEDEEEERSYAEEVAMRQGMFERIISQAVGEESSSVEDADAPADDAVSRLVGSGEMDDDEESSDSDSTNSDGGNESDSTARFDGARGRADSENLHSALLDNGDYCEEDEDAEIHDDDDDDDEDSSSSSSSDSGDGDADPEAMLVDDHVVEIDPDDEDDAMLRQALALSLAEHSSSLAAGNDTQNDSVREDHVLIENTEEGKLTPAVEGPSNSNPAEGESGISDSVDDDDISLPPLPVAPSRYPYLEWLSDVNVNQIDADHDATASGANVKRADKDEIFIPYLDPHSFSKFGSIPSAHVMMHLLLSAMTQIQVRDMRRSEAKEDSKALGAARPKSSIPGGVGCSLFSQPQEKTEKDNKDSNSPGYDNAMTIQLLIAMCALFAERRNEAIENLRKTILLEHQNVEEHITEDEKEEEGGRTPTCYDEDDPAHALAMNFASSTSHSVSSSSISESLEAKGMKRKAAAAAHDAAVLLKSIRKRVDAWKKRVQLFSHCTLIAMKCLRLYVGSTTVRTLLGVSSTNSSARIDWSWDKCVPSSVRSKLSVVLNSLMSISTQRSISPLTVQDDGGKTEQILLPLKLYSEAVLVWGECIPLLYPSTVDRKDLLRSLIKDCFSKRNEISPAPEPLEKLRLFPSSELQIQIHRLWMLCRRLRVKDLLNDDFVSQPISYNPEELGNVGIDEHQARRLMQEEENIQAKEPSTASQILRLLSSTLSELDFDEGTELRKLCLAICHKCNERVLLWDGFYSCSSGESDDRLAPSAASPAGSSSELLRISSNPSSNLQFDSTKCSDSITILANQTETASASNGSSAHQRASKVWGTVLSSSYFNPKTGVHRWAVRLDRCERGHVFVGVSTAQASVRTYVGGDKYGWGVIGTQALWHDRRKIRGDYGASFRTGSTIVVTLDTDAGTLSFSSWKDSNTASTAFSLEALQSSFSSPSRRSVAGGGTAEDWGIAFEGLPLDSRLYPAVGLYQRDDRVTLLNVEIAGRSSARDGVDGVTLSGGECYYPRYSVSLPSNRTAMSLPASVSHVRRYNNLLSWDGVNYVKDVLHRVTEIVKCEQEQDDTYLTSVLPSVSAALCLVPPSIPIISARCALALLPEINQCIQVLDSHLLQIDQHPELFEKGLKEGKWIIRATGSPGTLGASEYEEYVVNLGTVKDPQNASIGFEGSGVGTTGKSKNGLVAITGSLRGSSMYFVEEWTDGSEECSTSANTDGNSSSCVIVARLSLDGTKFEGTYRNVQYGTTGHIAGFLCSTEDDAPSAVAHDKRDSIVQCEALLCLAHGHLTATIGTDASGDLSSQMMGTDDMSTRPDHREMLKAIVSRPLLSSGLRDDNGDKRKQAAASLQEIYSMPPSEENRISTKTTGLIDLQLDHIFSSIPNVDNIPRSLGDSTDLVSEVDEKLSSLSGGKGSLHVLCPEEYSSSRRGIICALIYHLQLHDHFAQYCGRDASADADNDILSVWRTALRIMEDGIRRALSTQDPGTCSRRDICKDHCAIIDRVSSFLLKLDPCSGTAPFVSEEFLTIYGTVESENDLQYIEHEMCESTKRVVLRTVAIVEAKTLISTIENPVALECSTLVLPLLLGRALGDAAVAKVSAPTKEAEGTGKLVDDDLGGYYLHNLSGAGNMRHSLRQVVHSLFYKLGDILQQAVSNRKVATSKRVEVSIDSLVICILTAFTTSIRHQDINGVVNRSRILHHLSDLLSIHRGAIRTNHYTVSKSDEYAQESIVREIYEIAGRDISRVVLRTAISVSHVLSFQISRQTSMSSASTASINEDLDAVRSCANLLFGELKESTPFVEEILKEGMNSYDTQQADEQLKKWIEIHSPAKDGKSSTSERKKYGKQKSAVAYFRENGTLPPSPGTPTASAKVSSTKSSPSTPTGASSSDQLLSLIGAPFHHYITHLLHILSAMVNFSSSLNMLSEGSEWIKVLLRAVGLHCTFDGAHLKKVDLRQGDQEIMLPARYRIRILRLLLRLFTASKANAQLVEGLFLLAGSSYDVQYKTVSDEESFVSRESVSLLRQLHSPSRSDWRARIERVISIVGLDYETHRTLSLGILAFFTGSIGRICRGSYVLLKPAAAAPLSSDPQISSSSKSHGTSGSGNASSGAGTTPHHLVGNGTEGIVAGLCRNDASAGIVSSIDAKSGICEIILTNRQIDMADSPNLLEAPLRARSSEMGERGSGSGRFTMTVRAVRVPLADVVNAEEVPLFIGSKIDIGKMIGSQLPAALTSLSDKNLFSVYESNEKSNESESKGSNQEQEKTWQDQNYLIESGKCVVKLASSVMSLRSAITVMSDENILSNFVSESTSREVLHGVLQMASLDYSSRATISKFVEAVRLENLSSLPSHEARYCQLLLMLQEVNKKIRVLDSTPASHWEELIPQFLPKKKDNIHCDTGTAISSKGTEGYSTPPATEGSTSATRLASESGAERGERDARGSARNNPSDAQRAISQSTEATNSSEDEEDADSTAAAHLREAAIAQMAELGLPRSWSELALRRTGGTNIEAAVHFCLERGGDMERLLAEERERERMLQRQSSGGSSSTRRRRDSSSSNHLLRQLLEMGFPSRWCAEALAATRNDVDAALTWILTNGERLSAEDEGMEEDEDDDGDDIDDEDDEDEESGEEEEESGVGDSGSSSAISQSTEDANRNDTGRQANETSSNAKELTGVSSKPKKTNEEKSEDSESSVGWSGSVTPLRFVSGRSDIDPKTLAISGLPTGGFSSVGTKGVLLTTGKWYYEAILETAGCLQIGWADGSFSGHCHADRGDGCGDGPSSWAYDGWRRYRWHATPTEWGCRWKEGDVVGCLVDMDEHTISFTLNGRGEEIGMGVAFSGTGFRPCGGVYACVSFNRREKLRLILGGRGSEPFKYPPPPDYRGVGDAVLDAVSERDNLVKKEYILDPRPQPSTSDSMETGAQKPPLKRFLCDFSDGEHGHELFAWQHRYYGSDASVHLGSGRSKQLSGREKNSGTSSSSIDLAIAACVSRQMEKLWTKQNVNNDNQATTVSESTDPISLISKLTDSYKEAAFRITFDIIKECISLGTLYSRKLILHLMITMGDKFDIQNFLNESNKSIDLPNVVDDREVLIARQLWSVLDVCVSLRSAGWVGEAGAMAIAAEALGLGISSNDNHHHLRYLSTDRGGTESAFSFNDTSLLQGGGISQLLSTTLTSPIVSGPCGDEIDTSRFLAASAEAAIGGEGGGGPLVFLQRGLQSAVCRSKSFREILIAVVRRSVRLLAVVEYAGNDALQKENFDDEDMDLSAATFEKPSRTKGSHDEEDDQDGMLQPDARLACFLTGLLLSKPVQNSIPDAAVVKMELFEAWSIGLLSASSPWRMVCALTAAGILNQCPEALPKSVKAVPTLARFYSRLESTVVRRVWAERAAVPVCSRYVQSMIELLASVKHAIKTSEPDSDFAKTWSVSVDAATPIPLKSPIRDHVRTPLSKSKTPEPVCWEWEDGWITSDSGWEVWSGTAEFRPVDWKPPGRSAVRTLMDGGEGPPMLREGCHVMRGLDWEDERSGSKTGNEDGKELYEAEKAQREKEKQSIEEKESQQDPAAVTKEDTPTEETPAPTPEVKEEASDPVADSGGDQTNSPDPVESMPTEKKNEDSGEKKSQEPPGKKKKRRKIPSPKLPIGTVLSIEPWNGVPALGRKVRWHLTGEEGVYRYGGDGGRYDISHVEVNDKSTRVRKRHPLPESAEQCVSRHGFGSSKRYSVLLRIRRRGSHVSAAGEIEWNHQGVLELPDFGAGIRVDCTFHEDGAVTITEQELLYGSKDSGWEARFGQPSYKPGSVIVLSPTRSPTATEQANLDAKSAFSSYYEELLGSNSFTAKNLRNRGDGGVVRVISEMKLLRSKRDVLTDPDTRSLLQPIQAPLPPPIQFDRDFKASSISLSRDGRTVTCVAPDGRGSAFASVGFTKGVHYWEVKLEQADIGSVFIGVAEKPNGAMGSGTFGPDSQPRLNRWHGWGFVNFRATYTSGAERVYGAHCHAGDTVGVLLDCDAGRVSFFFDGLKYGEHILNDLGCAFENVSPFGFNADGCGSGGAGQGAPSGIEGGRGGRYPAQGSVKLRALWPVIGLRNPGDRVTISSKWMTGLGVDGMISLRNVLAVDEILHAYDKKLVKPDAKALVVAHDSDVSFPSWFIEESFAEYQRWWKGDSFRARTRGSGAYRLASVGLDIDVDTTPLASASACAALGLPHALLPGDRVVVKRSAGRMLELAEEALVLGACQGRLFYRLVSQKSEGGSLTEGGGRAWFWDESEVVDNGLQLIGPGRGLGIKLPLLDRFRCTSTGGLKIVYEGGAVVRSDLEIFDGSANIGTVPVDTIVPQKDVLERRVNSCGVVRYRIRYEPVGEGWISSRIRGGQEESIVLPLHLNDIDESKQNNIDSFPLPHNSAMAWYKEYEAALEKQQVNGKETSAPASSKLVIKDVDEFTQLFQQGLIPGLSVAESDSLVVSAVSAIADFSEGGDAVDCSFKDIVAALSFAVASVTGKKETLVSVETGIPAANQAAAAAFSQLNVNLPSLKALLARVAMLKAFNRRARIALPWLSVRPSQEGSALFGGLCGHGASIERAGRNIHTNSMQMWAQPPSIACRLRMSRGLVFCSVKRMLLDSITDATTTPTPLSHDEYELPREIRTVRINRLKARRAMAGDDNLAKRKHSVFSQLHNETRNWGGAALRRGFVAKGHGGQKRAFKVKLVGEGVNDYSGPYREAFTDAIREVMELDCHGQGALGVLEPTPNNSSEIGDNRELFMFSTGDRDSGGINGTRLGCSSSEESRIKESFLTLTTARNENSREAAESLIFLGRMVGTACRNGIPVDLPLPLHSIWKPLVEEISDDLDRVKEIDLLAHNQQLEKLKDSNEKPHFEWCQQRMLNSFVEGMSNVLPVEIFPIFTGEELRDILCGNPEVDVDLLRRVVEYEGYEETDDVVNYFWEALREMSNAERKKFLQFVWARSRLPIKESDFDAPFKIQKDSTPFGTDDAGIPLPSASTCFFSLTLPPYGSKDLLKRKLLFAIDNVCTMESDYVTNDAEVGEGWRGL